MKSVVLLALVMLASACGKKGDTGTSGPAGSNGSSAPVNQYNVAAILDPCGDAPGITDEVLLRLTNGQLLVFFANNVNGDYGRLALIGPGTYSTTDGSGCTFTVDNAGNVL